MTPKIAIITGEENVGKSTLCEKLLDYAQNKNLKVTGIISKLIHLAVYVPGWDKEKPERKWKFNSDGFRWGNKVLAYAIPSEVIFIDEIGYQELEKGNGWNNCFNILEQDSYKLAILVVRNNLLTTAKRIWKNAKVFELSKFHKHESIYEELKKLIDSLMK